MRYVYPALLQPDEGGYCVTFPDVEGAITCGSDVCEAIVMAENALSLMLVQMEDDGEKIPAPSDMDDIPRQKGDIVTLIRADTTEYRKLISSMAVKKTLTIPSWLNAAAEKQGVNFSRVLQDALKKELAIE